ncbi:G-protein coupled receptor 161-like [Stylophora pistillata]|uniref:G-protein coupled receptor 161-like n=1 Tax=Stylophora pistillata TaxID=50429 RepID=UPI000C0457A6|nr:G-protein coupled receptor 161-like [Stylophora pistillata]
MEGKNTSNTQELEDDPLGRTPLQVGIEVTIAVLICIACIVGNFVVVVAIHKTPRLNTITNMLVENLAWTDISMATLHLPFWIASMRSGYRLLGPVACKFVGFFELVFGTASLQTMAGIAVNRYFSIVKRNLYVKYFSDRKTTYGIIVSSWVFPLLACSPPLYGWGTIEFCDKFTDCTMGWHLKDISYIIFLLTVAIFITMIIIIYCYSTIFRFVRQRSRQLQTHNNLGDQDYQQRKATTEKENKIIKVFVAVVCLYTLCWTPVCVVGFCELLGYTAPRFVYIIVYYMMFSSSFCNPIIYGAFNPQFRMAFKQVHAALNTSEGKPSGRSNSAHGESSGGGLVRARGRTNLDKVLPKIQRTETKL